MAILTAEQLLAANDLPEETLAIPEWGGEVVLRALTRAQLQEVRNASDGDQLKYDSFMVAAAMKEPELTQAQALKLRRKNATVIERILQKLWSMNGITLAGDISAKAVDDAEAGFRDGETESG